MGIMVQLVVSLFAERAASTFVELSTETFVDEVVEPFPQGFELNSLAYLTDEGEFEQHSSFFGRYSSLLHVEKRAFVENPHRGAM